MIGNNSSDNLKEYKFLENINRWSAPWDLCQIIIR